MAHKRTASKYKTRAEDMAELRILDLYDGEGMTDREIADAVGLSKGTIVGMRSRIFGAHKSVTCRCRRKANRDGAMKRKWWAS